MEINFRFSLSHTEFNWIATIFWGQMKNAQLFGEEIALYNVWVNIDIFKLHSSKFDENHYKIEHALKKKKKTLEVVADVLRLEFYIPLAL